MAFPLMAIGAGIGQFVDSLNQQRQQKQQQQLAMLRMQFEQARFNQELEQKKQMMGLSQIAGALGNPFGGGGLGASGMSPGGDAGGFGMVALAPGAPSSVAPPRNTQMPQASPTLPPMGGGVLSTPEAGMLPSSDAGGGNDLRGSAINKLMSLGVDPALAQGAVSYMANIEAPGFDPNARNPTSGALGLGQWLGPRQQALLSQYGPRPTGLQQIDFIGQELQGPENATLQALRSAPAGSQKAGYDIWGRMFERPGEAALAKAGVGPGGRMPRETQVAQADTGTLSDAGPQLPPLPPPPNPQQIYQQTVADAARYGINPNTPMGQALINKGTMARFKGQMLMWQAQKSQWEMQKAAYDERYKESRDRRADAAATRAGERLEDAVDAQGNPTKVWVKPDGSVAPVKLPEGMKFPAKTGRAATGHFGDVNDLMDRWHQDFVSQNNREPTTTEIATQHAKLSQSIRPAGQLAQNMAERIMIGGNDAAKSVAAMAKLGPGATLGLFGGAQATLGPGLVENIKKNLANAVTPTSSQVLKSFSNGVGRALAMLMSGGSAQGVQQFSQMLANDVPQANDDGYTILSKYADIRDIADASLEVLRTDPRLTADQHKQVDEIMAKIQKAVPFNREDVAALVADPSEPTIAEFAQKMGFKGAGGGSEGSKGGAGTGPQEGDTAINHDTGERLIRRGGRWVPLAVGPQL